MSNFEQNLRKILHYYSEAESEVQIKTCFYGQLLRLQNKQTSKQIYNKQNKAKNG